MTGLIFFGISVVLYGLILVCVWRKLKTKGVIQDGNDKALLVAVGYRSDGSLDNHLRGDVQVIKGGGLNGSIS